MKRTLLVLGAGASKDVYEPFPTGYELIKEISYHLTTDKICPPRKGEGPYLSDMMNKIVDGFGKTIISSVHTLRTELWKIVLDYEWKYIRADKSPAPTIDRFVFEKIQSGYIDESAKRVARFAIAYLIKGCEQALAENTKEVDRNNWIDQLFHKLKGYSFHDVLTHLKVITFNYDRVFEYYALRHIGTYFPSVCSEQAGEFVRNVRHMYGSLGALEEIHFDAKNEGKKRLQTAYVRCDLMDYSGDPIPWPNGTYFENIYFLGFGYDEENLKRLNLGHFTEATRKGTGKGDVAQPYPIKVPCQGCFQFCRDEMEL